ncbi:MAG: gfo/Idh/MocA family oxidoreductase, partial [Planctomycetaceae bacterium]
MLTRRHLLQSAALAACSSLSLARSVRAAANDRLTLGFIGVGTMGRSHLNGFLGRGDVEVVAICDVVAERTRSAVEMVEGRY